MRTFSSYGPPDAEINFTAPRFELIQNIRKLLIGEQPEKEGHYITVWAPRQTGKTWVLNEVLFTLMEDERFHAVKINLEVLKQITNADEAYNYIASRLCAVLDLEGKPLKGKAAFENLFLKEVLGKPLILILDEFDALEENVIAEIVSAFRNIYIERRQEKNKATNEKNFLLHGVALVGVRSVLGVENPKGSPFNVQRSVRIPNLTPDEVRGLFQDYTRESEQVVETMVVERLIKELRGQPGLTCWFGELLTETYNPEKKQPITQNLFEDVWYDALNVLPNNNILNLISKAKQEPYKDMVLKLYETGEKTEFKYDDPVCNFLFTQGVIDGVKEGRRSWIRFASPFVQKRLFNHFSHQLFDYVGKFAEPFEDLSDTIDDERIYLPNLLRRYERYLKKNRDWLLKKAPRREDLRIYEAVFHFNLYQFLYRFLGRDVEVTPEFPTGNGKIDLLIRRREELYGVELKSFTNFREHEAAIDQAAGYAKQLGLSDITLACFVEGVNETNRKKLETKVTRPGTGIKVQTVLIEIGE